MYLCDNSAADKCHEVGVVTVIATAVEEFLYQPKTDLKSSVTVIEIATLTSITPVNEKVGVQFQRGFETMEAWESSIK